VVLSVGAGREAKSFLPHNKVYEILHRASYLDCGEETKEIKMEDSLLGLRNIKSLHLHICVATDVVRERGRRAGCPRYHGSIPQRAKNWSLHQKAHTGYRDLCPGAKWPERKLTTHPYPVQRLEVNGAILPLS